MTEGPDAQPSRQTSVLVVLGLAALLLLGTVIGFWFGGRDSDVSGTTVVVSAPSTTPAPSPTTTIATVTTTTAPGAPSTTSSQPSNEQQAFAASEDTVVDSDDPNTVLGAAEVLDIEQDGADDERRALLRFVVELPPGASVTQAILRLTLLEASSSVGLVNTVGGEWGELTTTWATAPPIGDPVAPLPGGAEGTQVDVDVTPIVTGAGRFDFYLTLSSPESLDFASRESPGGPPALLITIGDAGEAEEGGAILVGAGDIASCSSDGDEATASLLDEVVERADQAVVFTAGDNAYEDGSAQSFADCYQPSWGRHKAITRPAPGSREYRTPGAAGYFGYFGTAAGDPAEGWYSYNFAGWHIVVINSNCTAISGCEAGSAQEQWLRQDLGANNATCIAAYWHQPLFSSRSGGTNPEMVPIFQALFDANADVVINGNDHFYERFLPQEPDGDDESDGITQFTVGTGGRSLDEYGGPTRNSGVRYNHSFGVLALTLQPAGYEWEFLTPPGTAFSDFGSAVCN